MTSWTAFNRLLEEEEAPGVTDLSAETIVFGKNQSVLFSVIRFYSQRSRDSIWKWKCHFAGRSGEGGNRRCGNDGATVATAARWRWQNHHNLCVGRNNTDGGLYRQMASLLIAVAVPTVIGGIHDWLKLLKICAQTGGIAGKKDATGKQLACCNKF